MLLFEYYFSPFQDLYTIQILMARIELSPQLRSRICELRSIGYSCNKIHKIHSDITISTIKTTCRRGKSRIDNKSKPRSGAPRKLSEEQRDHLYNIAIYQNPYIKHRDLLEEVDRAIKKRSLQGLLREIDRRKWRQQQRSEIKLIHAEKRLQ